MADNTFNGRAFREKIEFVLALAGVNFRIPARQGQAEEPSRSSNSSTLRAFRSRATAQGFGCCGLRARPAPEAHAKSFECQDSARATLRHRTAAARLSPKAMLLFPDPWSGARLRRDVSWWRLGRLLEVTGKSWASTRPRNENHGAMDGLFGNGNFSETRFRYGPKIKTKAAFGFRLENQRCESIRGFESHPLRSFPRSLSRIEFLADRTHAVAQLN